MASSIASRESARRTGETFGFDAWLFFCQVFSFTVVALILQKFAYKPDPEGA